MIPVSRANSCKEPALTSWQRRIAWMVSECEMRNCSTWAAQDGGGREENCIICIIHLFSKELFAIKNERSSCFLILNSSFPHKAKYNHALPQSWTIQSLYINTAELTVGDHDSETLCKNIYFTSFTLFKRKREFHINGHKMVIKLKMSLFVSLTWVACFNHKSSLLLM